MNTKPIALGFNIDHIINIRQARLTPYPDIVDVVESVEQAGADAITLHLREDRRHIQDSDVDAVREHCKTRMNLEMAATDEMTQIALKIQPEDCCIVPEKREELTTEGGLDVVGAFERIKNCTQTLTTNNIKVSLFIEPNIEHIKRAVDMGAPVIELHTGHYANYHGDEQSKELEQIAKAADFAHAQGIQVNAGHGLDNINTLAIAALPEIVELNIGHYLVARSVFVGLKQAIEEMKAIFVQARK
ncbi:MAG: pyridoxine 5'-phosphate synthase [Thiotrichaceae bacterium]|nr:pyridoxine 5'-phosphate synthase [Thiotrichaceae bacterium]